MFYTKRTSLILIRRYLPDLALGQAKNLTVNFKYAVEDITKKAPIVDITCSVMFITEAPDPLPPLVLPETMINCLSKLWNIILKYLSKIDQK